MNKNLRGMLKEEAHAKNLRLKLAKELPDEVLEHCETRSDLEHAKKAYNSVSQWKETPRTTEKNEALKYEFEASEDLINENI